MDNTIKKALKSAQITHPGVKLVIVDDNVDIVEELEKVIAADTNCRELQHEMKEPKEHWRKGRPLK